MQMLIKFWDKLQLLYIEPLKIVGAFLMFQVWKFFLLKSHAKVQK